MTVPIICLTNGRDCVFDTLASIRAALTGAGDVYVLDDTGDTERHKRFQDVYPGATVAPIESAGYWRAMQQVWQTARDLGCDSFVFWEDDFLARRPIDLTGLAKVLHEHPHLTQVALVRQPWWPNEHAHGGLIEALEAQGQVFTEQTDQKHWWIEHRACFTGNPSIIPRRTFEKNWPEGSWSEASFGKLLFADPGARGAYWGRRGDRPLVTHIGHQRVGSDY